MDLICMTDKRIRCWFCSYRLTHRVLKCNRINQYFMRHMSAFDCCHNSIRGIYFMRHMSAFDCCHNSIRGIYFMRHMSVFDCCHNSIRGIYFMRHMSAFDCCHNSIRGIILDDLYSRFAFVNSSKPSFVTSNNIASIIS